MEPICWKPPLRSASKDSPCPCPACLALLGVWVRITPALAAVTVTAVTAWAGAHVLDIKFQGADPVEFAYLCKALFVSGLNQPRL